MAGRGPIAYAYKKLATVANYQEDWDGEGGKAVAEDSAKAAKSFLDSITESQHVIVPTASSEGHVVFEAFDMQTKEFVGEITFRSTIDAELYLSTRSSLEQRYYEGRIDDPSALLMINEGLGIIQADDGVKNA